jgi:toxin-antitoxin system PIN domain toxin
VKLPDVNLLIYAIDEEAPGHEPARAWLEGVLSGTEAVGFAWAVLLGFLRISTSPAILERPLGLEEALDYVEGWLAQPPATVLSPTARHAALLRQLLAPLGVAGNLTSDAHLAALAIEHGAELCSADTDFARFTEVAWRNPLTHP